MDVDNPCTEAVDPVDLVVETSFREHLHSHGRITLGIMTVVGEDAWTGRGIDSGVEIDQGETVSHRLMVNNSETGDRFKFTVVGHYNANKGEWNFEPFPESVRCVGRYGFD